METPELIGTWVCAHRFCAIVAENPRRAVVKNQKGFQSLTSERLGICSKQIGSDGGDLLEGRRAFPAL